MNTLNDKLKQKILTLYNLYTSGKIPTLAEHEVNPGLPKNDRLNYLYFTLPVCINFQRSSPAMWKSALATFLDDKTNYVFLPEKVVETPPSKLQQDLVKHKLALQPNKHTEIWSKISTAFNLLFDNDPRKLLQKSRHDVKNVIHILQKEHVDNFPYLRGPKLSNYWLYILTRLTDAKLSNMGEISIIPDTHVIKSTYYLGLTDNNAPIPQIEQAWKNVLKDTGISPVEMHPVLWNWSRNNFLPEV